MKKEVFNFRRTLQLVLGVFFLGLFLSLGKFIWEVSKLRPQVMTVQTSGGNQALVFSHPVSAAEQIAVSLQEVPEVLKQVTLVVEASTTMAQQLARQYPADEALSRRHITLSFQRLVTTMFFEKEFSEEELMELYFNETSYGQGIRGVGQAAKVYFNKSVDQLTLAESIVLAGLPQRPTNYDLRRGEKNVENEEVLWFVRANHIAKLIQERGLMDSDTFQGTFQAIRTLRDERLPDYDNWSSYSGETFSLRYPEYFLIQMEGQNKLVLVQPNQDPSQWCYGELTCLKVTVTSIKSPTLERFIQNDRQFASRTLATQKDYYQMMDEHKKCHCYYTTTTAVRGETMQMVVYRASRDTGTRVVVFSPTTSRGYDFLIEGTSEDGFMIFDFDPMLNSIRLFERVSD